MHATRAMGVPSSMSESRSSADLAQVVVGANSAVASVFAVPSFQFRPRGGQWR